jgi:hypothetical protein
MSNNINCGLSKKKGRFLISIAGQIRLLIIGICAYLFINNQLFKLRFLLAWLSNWKIQIDALRSV